MQSYLFPINEYTLHHDELDKELVARAFDIMIECSKKDEDEFYEQELVESESGNLEWPMHLTHRIMVIMGLTYHNVLQNCSRLVRPLTKEQFDLAWTSKTLNVHTQLFNYYHMLDITNN